MLEIKELGKTYRTGRSEHEAISKVSLLVDDGEFVSVVGPSGCGKTTLLRCIAGLLQPTVGEVLLNGVAVTAPQPTIAVVFQDYSRSLFPWLSVLDNVSLPLRATGTSAVERRTRALEAIASVGLGDAAERYPWQLSGGMQQRVAIARALVVRPEVLLMDEPFASVDAQTREELEDLVQAVHGEYGMSTLLITHDVDEAVYLSDKVAVLSKSPTLLRGEIEVSLAKPREQLATKADNEFAHVRAQVHGLLRSPSSSTAD